MSSSFVNIPVSHLTIQITPFHFIFLFSCQFLAIYFTAYLILSNTWTPFVDFQALDMICCWIEDPNSDALKLHLPRIYDYLWLAEDGMKAQVTLSCPLLVLHSTLCSGLHRTIVCKVLQQSSAFYPRSTAGRLSICVFPVSWMFIYH
jgi:hypothetical protein